METKDCDCMKDTENKINEHLSARKTNPEGFEIVSSDCEYKSWYPKKRLYVNYIVKSTFKKKDGTTSKPKNEHISFYFTYCPFCGKKYEEEKKI